MSSKSKKRLLIAFSIAIATVVLICLLQRNPPLAVVRVNETTEVAVLNVHQGTMGQLFIGNPLQRACRLLLCQALKVRSNLPRWLIGLEMQDGSDKPITWCVTHMRLSTRDVALSLRNADLIQVNLLSGGKDTASGWGQQVNSSCIETPDGSAIDVYGVWRFPLIEAPTLELEVYEPTNRVHGQRITVPNPQTAH